MVSDAAVRAEQLRDLRSTISEIASEDSREWVFKETSPARRKVTLYSLINGEEIQVGRGQLESVLARRGPTSTGYLWTANKELAPEYHEGSVKCFLHPLAPERAILNKIGISTICDAAHHPNRHAMEIVAQHKHRNQWDAYQAYLAEEAEQKAEDRAERQLEATLELARAAVQTHGTQWLDNAGELAIEPGKVAAAADAGLLETFPCDECDKVCASKTALLSHKRSHIDQV